MTTSEPAVPDELVERAADRIALHYGAKPPKRSVLLHHARIALAAVADDLHAEGAAKARREDGGLLRRVDCWDQVHMLVARWIAGEAPCGATGRAQSRWQSGTFATGPCLLTAGHTVPGHDDGDGGRWWTSSQPPGAGPVRGVCSICKTPYCGGGCEQDEARAAADPDPDWPDGPEEDR